MNYSKVSDTTFTKTESVEILYDINEIKEAIAQEQAHLVELQGNIAVTEAKIVQLQALLAEGEKVGVVEIKEAEELNGN